MTRFATYKLWIIFILLFILIVLLAPPNPITLAQYNLTHPSYRVLFLATVGLPAFITWFAAFYGYEQLRTYSVLIRKSNESSAFEDVTKGSRWIAMYLPVVILVSVLFMGLANEWSSLRGPGLVLSNYVGAILSIVAFTHVGTGARKLTNNANVRPSLNKVRWLMATFILVGVLYCYYIVEHGQRPSSPYYLPVAVVLLTIVVPYFYAWFMGLLAILDIEAYAATAPGILYRKALRLLSGGLLIIIISSILLQLINSANTHRGRLIFGSVLVARYVFYLTISLGFVLVGRSAKKLQQIEKI
jgi:hypothetical protein